GFGPFLSFVLDQHGADGPPNCDGVTFVKAEMIGTTPSPVPLPPIVTASTLLPCGTGTATHPLAASTPGWSTNPPPVPASPYPVGSQLVTVRLPFGSVDQSQPDMRVEVT